MPESRVAHAVDERDTLEFLKDCVRMPSVTGSEAGMARIVGRKMHDIGLSVEEVGGNVIGKWENDPTGKTVILCGHMDTVPLGERKQWTVDPFGAEMKGNKLYGRGSLDMKGGLAAMIGGVAALRKSNHLKGNITLIATIYEEPGKEKLIERKGIVDLLDKEKVKGDLCIITEPTNLVVGLGHKGACNTEIAVWGKAAHGSAPHLGINAIEKASRLVIALKDLPTAEHPVLGKGMKSINLINGGNAINTVPEYCKIEIDRRLTIGESADTVKRDIEKIIDKLKAEDRDFKAEVTISYTYQPILIENDHPIVNALLKAISSVSGMQPEKRPMPWGTDGAWIKHRANIPVVIFGPGNWEVAHKPDEYVDVNQVYTAARVYALAASEFLAAS